MIKKKRINNNNDNTLCEILSIVTACNLWTANCVVEYSKDTFWLSLRSVLVGVSFI